MLKIKKNTIKLDQLTSLRFFAAFVILYHHSVGLFGIESIGLSSHGVSFFFVLSGFILGYVYSDLDTMKKTKLFWKARFARIWPAYFASFLFGFWLIPYTWDTTLVLPFIFMVQGWIPVSSYYFSYNSVSWSVSVEFFFYLAFPFILYNFKKTWLLKLLISGVLVVFLVIFSNYLSLPVYSPPNSNNTFELTQTGLLYISPLSRMFEFVFGMVMAQLFKKNEFSTKSSRLYIGTLYEVAILGICAASLYYRTDISAWGSSTVLGPSIGVWLSKSSSVFVFGVLIYVLAHGYGLVSRLLAFQFFVLLGEISFSLYLIHQMLLTYYRLNPLEFIQLSDQISFGIFIIITLLISYLMWSYIEMPARRLMLGGIKIHGSNNLKKLRKSHFKFNRKMLIDVVVLSSLILMVNSINGQTEERQKLLRDKIINTNTFHEKHFKDSDIITNTLKNNNLIFNTRRLEKIENLNNGIVVKSNHKDPSITFHKLNLEPNNTYILHIQIYVSKYASSQLFYSNVNTSGYPFSESRVINCTLNMGENNIYILLDDQNLGTSLRFDPVSENDIDINISKFEIRKIHEF